MTPTGGAVLYYDLNGEPTGEYRFCCSRDGTEADCESVIAYSKDGHSVKIKCNGAGSDDACNAADPCGVTLTARRGPADKIQLFTECGGGTGECGPGRVRRIVPGPRRVNVIHPNTTHAHIRYEQVFRCECVEINPPEVRAFYSDKIGAIVSFAMRRGIELNPTDLFHAHVITDTVPEYKDEDGEWLFDEEFMLQRYKALLSHAHDYDGRRSATEDNFNIYLEGTDPVRFVGSTVDVLSGDPRVVSGPWPRSIYFRWCADGEECPPCTAKVWCEDQQRHMCVGLRQRWPAGDPALSW